MILPNLPTWVQVVLTVAPALAATFAALSLIVNVQQFRRMNAQARASIVTGCLQGFAADGDMQNAYYAIEYGGFRFDDGFPDSSREREADRLLRHFANIALAWQGGLLTLRDVKPLEYYILRIMTDGEIRKYLDFVVSMSRQVSPNEHPYAVLAKLGRALIASGQPRRPARQSSGRPPRGARRGPR